jgi:hypothetical protein
MWEQDQTDLPNIVSPEFSDARSDVIRTGVLVFRGIAMS